MPANVLVYASPGYAAARAARAGAAKMNMVVLEGLPPQCV